MSLDTEIAACSICSLSNSDAYVVLTSRHWRIRHSQETNILGYCILESRRHILDLSEANSNELAEYGSVLSALMKAQRRRLDCQRIYTFSLAEAVPHFHLHVIPRDKDFKRAYKGRGIMSYPTSPAASPALVGNLLAILRTELRHELSGLLISDVDIPI